MDMFLSKLLNKWYKFVKENVTSTVLWIKKEPKWCFDIIWLGFMK